MLIILSGPRSIRKTDIARRIYSAFVPDFEYMGYTVSFKEFPFAIYNENKELVYLSKGGESITTILSEPNGKQIFDDLYEIHCSLMIDSIGANNYMNIFMDLPTDCGINWYNDRSKFAWEDQPQQLPHPQTLESVLQNYQNKKYPVHIVLGSFSKAFITEVKKSIGEDNVTVINILRNPFVDRVMSFQKSETYFNDDMTLEEHKLEQVKAIINSAFLAEQTDVLTLRYEQIIKDGFFMLNGVKVAVFDLAYNDYITHYEKEIFKEDSVTDNLQDYHELLSNVMPILKDPRIPYLVNKPNLNVLESTNYTPLTVNQIVAPKE